MPQDPLPDVVPGVIPAIEAAAHEYLVTREARAETQKEEEKAQETLLAVMKDAEVEFYKTTDGFDCILDIKEKVKVSKPKSEKD